MRLAAPRWRTCDRRRRGRGRDGSLPPRRRFELCSAPLAENRAVLRASLAEHRSVMGRRRNRSAGASPVAPPASALPPPPPQFLQRQRRDDDTWSLVSGTSSFDVPSCASLALPSRDVVSLASYAPSVVSLASAPPSVVGEDLCTICCEPLDEPGAGVVCMPTCTHVYHGSCLRAWLRTAPTGGCRRRRASACRHDKRGGRRHRQRCRRRGSTHQRPRSLRFGGCCALLVPVCPASQLVAADRH